MTDEQLDFWQELLAAFPKEEVYMTKSGGQGEQPYVDRTVLYNRLDTACGPHGWTIEFRETSGGLTARMGIFCPQRDGSWAWVYKEDGAGRETMTKKVNGVTVTDNDNTEKTGYTNAAKRVGQDAWGIGRYLRGKGFPAWLRPDYQRPEPVPASTPPPSAKETSRRPEDRPGTLGLPKSGKGVWRWAKDLEERYGASMTSPMGATAKDRGYPSLFSEWDEAQTRDVCGWAVESLVMRLPNYDGAFGPASREGTASGTDPFDGVKKEIVVVARGLARQQLGREGTAEEIEKAIKTISSHVNQGFAVGSLKDCENGPLLAKILKETRRISEVPVTPSPAGEAETRTLF